MQRDGIRRAYKSVSENFLPYPCRGRLQEYRYKKFHGFLSKMFKFILAALCCYSTLPVESAGPSKRQSAGPKDCSALVLEVNVTSTACPSLSALSLSVDAVANQLYPQWNTPQGRDWLENTLDDFCTTDCLTYTVEYYSQNCSGPNEDMINLYQNYYCGSSDTTGQYCLLEFMNYFADTTTILDAVLQCMLCVFIHCR